MEEENGAIEPRICALESCGKTFVAKVCSACKEALCPCQFNKDKKTPDGLTYKCRECHRTYHRDWRKKNDANTHSTASRYSMSPDELRAMRRSKENKCDACGRTVEKLNIDHDHSCCNRKGSCGKCIRGMLCTGCNTALGAIEDEIWRLDLLKVYLEKWATKVQN